ncbi:MAG: type II toxin-antitoxin system VapC family toxin [Acidobacteria bacterium]|nr:type II toxin-antitoxin system VapC family toxin [Acidobacteriota bacterium]
MTVFVDTSAFYAVLDRDDSNHEAARAAWERLLRGSAVLLTSNYVLLETSALVQHRLGVAALRALHQDVVPILRVEWVTEAQHRAAVEALLTAARKKLSLVDCVSFQLMRDSGVRQAFCFDKHFQEQGFGTTP